ncbi:MAG TPA: bifunctional DNA primase/polymerase [Urbifossiella sp.]|nr:bifunctional DNA primase/polymerase [Urbifossiella sp.]
MHGRTLTDILFLAEHHGFRLVPAAGPDWKADFDRGKQPLVSIHHATTDPARLTAWADQYRGCNWLYVPGDGQLVLDVDPRHGGDRTLAELLREHGPLPRTAEAGTGGGGVHYHFAAPAGLGVKTDLKGNPGLTLAGGGRMGFVVPPCVHRSGKPYAWRTAPWDVAPAVAPAWLLAVAETRSAVVKPPADAGAVQVAPPAASGSHVFVWAGGGLASHPGSTAKELGGEGRRPTLVTLVARELGRGRSADELEPEVLAWAGRCTPPLDAGEALRQLRGMARRHGAVGGAGQHHTPTTVPAVPDDPEGSRDEDTGREEPPAFLTHGLVGDFTRLVAPQIEGGIEPVVFCLLACVGSAAGPGPSVRVGAARHRANLFGVVVAPSGVGKSEPWDVCSTLMEFAAPDWHRAAPTGLGSGEGLIERLQDQPVAFAVESEFGAVLTKARRDGSTLGPTVCNAWDGRTMEVANRGGHKLRAEGHHVAVWANITDAELHKRIGNSLEAVNGFGNRFLWLRQRRVRYLPRGGDLRCLMELAGPVRRAVAAATAAGEVRWGPGAVALWDAAYQGLCDGQAAHWSLGRARSQALRLVLLYTLLDGARVITPAHVEAGLSAWGWAEASAQGIFMPPAVTVGDSGLAFVWGAGAGVPQHPPTPIGGPAAGCGEKVMTKIEAHPGIGRGELTKSLNLKAETVGEVLARLRAEGKAHPRLTPGRGRTAECWWPGACPEDDPEEGRKPPAESGPPPLPSFVPSPGGGPGGYRTSPASDLPSFVWEAAEGSGDECPGVIPDGSHPADATAPGDSADGGGVDPPRFRPEPSPERVARYEKAQAEYQAELRRRRGDDDPPMTEDEFMATLRGVHPPA